MTATQIFGLALAALLAAYAYFSYRAARALLEDGREQRRYKALIDEDRAREIALQDELIDLEVGLAASDLDNELAELLASSVTTCNAGAVSSIKGVPMSEKFDAGYDALRPVADDKVRRAAAVVLTALEAVADDNRQLREGPACRLKPGAVAAVVEYFANQFTREGPEVKAEEILNALTTAGRLTIHRDGEDDVYTLTGI